MANSTFGAIGSDITLGASQSVRRNSANNAFEAFTTSNDPVTLAAGAYLIAPVEQYTAANVGCTVAANNDVQVFGFVPKATISVTAIVFDVQVLLNGGLCSIGIYDAAGTTKLIDTGTKSTTSTGVQTASISPAVTLYGNTFYWFAFAIDNTTAAIRGIISPVTGVLNILNGSTVYMGKAANAATSGALPSSLGAISSQNRGIPMVKLQG